MIGKAGMLSARYAAWNVAAAQHVQSLSVGLQDTIPQDIFMRGDGLKMYLVGAQNEDVYEYDLSAAWDISTASYSQSFHVGSQDGSPSGLFFKSDGLSMFVAGAFSEAVYEYGLGAAWDISTASFVHSKSVLSEGQPETVFFRANGTKMLVGTTFRAGFNDDKVHEYSLTSAWNVSTASFLRSFDVSSKGSPDGMFFKPDGLKLYICNSGNLHEYNLTSAYNVSTASYFQTKSVSAQGSFPSGLFFKEDGLRLYVINHQDVDEYKLEFV